MPWLAAWLATSQQTNIMAVDSRLTQQVRDFNRIQLGLMADSIQHKRNVELLDKRRDYEVKLMNMQNERIDKFDQARVGRVNALAKEIRNFDNRINFRQQEISVQAAKAIADVANNAKSKEVLAGSGDIRAVLDATKNVKEKVKIQEAYMAKVQELTEKDVTLIDLFRRRSDVQDERRDHLSRVLNPEGIENPFAPFEEGPAGGGLFDFTGGGTEDEDNSTTLPTERDVNQEIPISVPGVREPTGFNYIPPTSLPELTTEELEQFGDTNLSVNTPSLGERGIFSPGSVVSPEIQGSLALFGGQSGGMDILQAQENKRRAQQGLEFVRQLGRSALGTQPTDEQVNSARMQLEKALGRKTRNPFGSIVTMVERAMGGDVNARREIMNAFRNPQSQTDIANALAPAINNFPEQGGMNKALTTGTISGGRAVQ